MNLKKKKFLIYFFYFLDNGVVNNLNGNRTSRTKTRISQSQPSSRSTSPTSRLNYLTNLTNSNNQLINGTRRRSGIPLLSSRDSSPNRTLERRASLTRINNKELNNKLEKQNSSERLFYSIDNNLIKNQDLVDSFNGLLLNNNSYAKSRRLNDDHSDESETSSICSDLSFTSNGRNFEVSFRFFFRFIFYFRSCNKKINLIDHSISLYFKRMQMKSYVIYRVLIGQIERKD